MENKRINMVAMFEKVSYEQFKKDLTEGENTIDIDDTALKEIYDNIELPRRATEGSAGYDFFLPYTPSISTTSRYVRICTGIRCNIKVEGWALFLYPKSGIGSRYGVSLRNTIGVVDSDYYFAENEGHIIVNLSSDEMKAVYDGDVVLKKEIDENHEDDSKEEVEEVREYSLTYLQKDKGFVQGVLMPFGITEDDTNVSKDKRVGGFGSTSKE